MFLFKKKTFKNPSNGKFSINTQNPFEVNQTIIFGVKIRHDHKWGYHNSIQTFTRL
jgi:hypothetical protein